MRRMVIAILCVWIASSLWGQNPKDFEGAWVGSFVHDNQAARTWTYVFENVERDRCTGFLWTGRRTPWSKCEIKDGIIAVYLSGATPIVTGKIASSTQLELSWHAKTQVHTFIAVKQPAAYVKSLVDPTTIAGVSVTHLGIYRALAGLIVEEVNNNDMARAAKLGRILEIAWDRGESTLQSKSPQIWGEIDGAMDQFINPILSYQKAPPDAATIKSAYRTYLNKLVQADTAK